MLSMKTLRVAFVTMGSALLLGSGVSVAQTINLDSLTPQPTAQYAVETLSNQNVVQVSPGVNYFTLASARSALSVQVTATAALAVGDGYFARVSLSDGMVFSEDPTSAGHTLVVGGVRESVAVFRLGGSAINRGDTINVDLSSKLAVRTGDPTTYSASISIHGEQFDAYDNVGAIAAAGGGSAPIVTMVEGIDAAVTPAQATPVADVATGFTRFVGGSGNAVLGTVKVALRANNAGTVEALDAGTGNPVMGLIGDGADAGAVTVQLSGNLGIGVWNLEADAANCPATVGSPNAPVDPADPKTDSNLQLGATDKNVATRTGLGAGTYSVCVTVDTAGPNNPNTTAIPAGTYTARAYNRRTSDTRDDVMVAEGTVGSIGRNGTTVRLAYLTTSDKYNQRVVIVNHGTRAATYEIGEFAAESGVTVEAGSRATGSVGAGESLVVRVSDVVTISDGSRTSAVLSMNADVTDVSIATTQVNLEDGSTDTVLYATEGGAAVAVN